MCSTVTLLTAPLASLNQMPYSTLVEMVQSWNPAAGPETVRFWMFIVCPADSFVRIPPFHWAPPLSVALIVKPPPSTVVIAPGTSIGAVVAHGAVSVNVEPVKSPTQGPSVEGTALATPPPTRVTGTATAKVIAMKTNAARTRDIAFSLGSVTTGRHSLGP